MGGVSSKASPLDVDAIEVLLKPLALNDRGAADLKAARKETITAEHSNMTDEDYIKNLPEHHFPSWAASYNKNKTEEAEKAAADVAKTAAAEAKKKTEDVEMADEEDAPAPPKKAARPPPNIG